ncbi:hypothetical protein DFH29DRAFT_985259 [Suillus ampliporus]|nr:hypothetical protein DFH29DRAFT_985259 [Suillus ampliporus]
MVVAKICLLLCTIGAQYYAMTPPNARPPPKERLEPTGWEIAIAVTPVLSRMTLRCPSSAALFVCHCYSTLGRTTKLVTSGPYSIVRHPSYAGGLCVLLGVLLCHFHTQSWLVSCSGVFPSSGQAVKLDFGVVVYSGLGNRLKKEEAMLEGNFGDQWRSYAKRVPYRLVPWLY